MGYFVIKSKNKLAEMNINDKINESDFATLTPDGIFVQLQYVEDETTVKKFKVKPGVWSIQKTMEGMKLVPTSFVSDKILESFVNTKTITDKIDCFFNKIPIYKELGFDVAKRAALLYGPAGTGKSTAISVISSKYSADNKTAVIIWHTDKFEPYQVKDFIKSFEYVDVDKIILIAEDIGGTEIEQARMRSDSSLLSLLDNQEKTFTIPTFILATTNYPENFMGNLTNRPNRFDDKIQVGYPTGPQREELLKFFAKEDVPQDAKELIQSNRAAEFSAAHIREVVIRSRIFDQTYQEVISGMIKEIEEFKRGFVKENRMGFERD